ncbi:hypothetical protein [Mucilaginibacter sp.]|uniref:hypothetical protein n=1 Tax=Mucilaginibacter sp. TaxID=1882438 RepID=UPI003B004359
MIKEASKTTEQTLNKLYNSNKNITKKMKKILLYGATGRTGQHVLNDALATAIRWLH